MDFRLVEILVNHHVGENWEDFQSRFHALAQEVQDLRGSNDWNLIVGAFNQHGDVIVIDGFSYDRGDPMIPAPRENHLFLFIH